MSNRIWASGTRRSRSGSALHRAVKAAFKIQGFIITGQHGMVLRLTAEIQLYKAAFSVSGGFGNHAPPESKTLA